MKNILISGYYGFNNTGDEAMIETMSSLLAKRDCSLTVLSSNPDRTKELYNVEAYNRFKLSEVKKAIKKADLIISGGGTLFQDITSKKSIWYYLGIVKLAQLYRKKIVVCYQGMGPINTPFYRWMTKHILNKKSVKFVGMRDNHAIDYAKEIGIKENKIIFSSDMIFMMNPPPTERIDKIIKDNVLNLQEGQKLIGFSVREWKDKDRTDDLAQAADLIIERYNARIVFFPFHKPKDAEISKIIMHKMKHEEKASIMPNRYLPSEILGAMGRMDVNIGVRLHSLVFSAICNVPTIGISYDPKIDGFLDMIGAKPACTYEDIDSKRIADEVGNMLLNKDVNYVEKIKEFKQKGEEALEKIIAELS
ncbi:MAG: polysaccharide pyruvyl transferase CsaB [Clostridia bacterium]|nr:polysaccharide pyruvyl transferase CsaB [Clostridia bacterium]